MTTQTVKLKIEFKPRLYATGSRAGQKIAGDRDVWIAGERWGYLVMEGGRYRSLTLYNVGGTPIFEAAEKGDRKTRHLVVRSPRRWDKDHGRTLLDLAEDAIRAAIKDGRMVEPAKIRAQEEAHRAAMAASKAEADRRRDLMRKTLCDLWQSSQDANVMEGLELAFEEIFLSPITDQFVAKKKGAKS